MWSFRSPRSPGLSANGRVRRNNNEKLGNIAECGSDALEFKLKTSTVKYFLVEERGECAI